MDDTVAAVIDIRVLRQARCAATPEGHRFTPDGICERCDLTVHPQLHAVR